MTADEICEKINSRWYIRAQDATERSEVFDILENLGYSSEEIVRAMGRDTYPDLLCVGLRYTSQTELWIYRKDDDDNSGILEFADVTGADMPFEIPTGEAFTAALDALLF